MPHDKRAEDVQIAEAIVQAMESDVKAILEAFPTPPGMEPMSSMKDVLRRFDQMSQEQKYAFLQGRPGALREIMKAMTNRNGAQANG